MGDDHSAIYHNKNVPGIAPNCKKIPFDAHHFERHENIQAARQRHSNIPYFRH